MLVAFRKVASMFRFAAFDTSNESGRSMERYRRAALTTLVSVGARGISILTSLITVPLTLNYLGVERYGVWVTVSSMITMLGLADLGIGNGLLNAIAGASGRDDQAESARVVSSGFIALALIAAGIVSFFLVLYPVIPWARVLNLQSAQATAEAGPVVAVLVITFVCGMPLSIVSKVRRAYQEGFIDSLWGIAGSISGLLAVLVAVRMQAGLPALALSMAGAPLLCVAANGVWLFYREYPWLRPRWTNASAGVARGLLSVGGYFFILQVAGAVAYQSDSIVLAQVMGPQYVAQYAVPMKIFMLVPSILGVAFISLWPAYTEALARGDHSWVWRTFLRSVKIAFVVSLPVSGILVIVAGPLLMAWVGPAIHPGRSLLLAAGTWAVVNAVSVAISMYFNGIGVLRFQAIVSVLMMFANVILSIALTNRLGVSGVLWGSVVAQVVFILLPSTIYLYRHRPTARSLATAQFTDSTNARVL